MEEVQPVTTFLPDGRVMVTGRKKMVVPQGGKHVRQAEARIEPPLKGHPVVIASVVAADTAGTVFGLYDVQTNDLGSQTQVAFSATNVQSGQISDDEFYCSYIIVGEPKSSGSK